MLPWKGIVLATVLLFGFFGGSSVAVAAGTCRTSQDCPLNNDCSLTGKCRDLAACEERIADFEERSDKIRDAEYAHWGVGWLIPFVGAAILGNSKAWAIQSATTVWEAMTGLLTYATYRAHQDRPLCVKSMSVHQRGCLTCTTVGFYFMHVGFWIATGLGFEYFRSFREADGPGTADLVVLGGLGSQTISITQSTFGGGSCAVAESCIKGTGERRLLRFSTLIGNIGDESFVTGKENLEIEYSGCHKHWHSKDATSYWLATGYNFDQSYNQTQVAELRKQGYCFLDNERFMGDHPGKFSCGSFDALETRLHGISPGWYDNYSNGIDCQWIDITNVAPGQYYLVNDINPDGIYCQDRNLTNNRVVYKITIPPTNLTLERLPNGINIAAKVLVDYDGTLIRE